MINKLVSTVYCTPMIDQVDRREFWNNSIDLSNGFVINRISRKSILSAVFNPDFQKWVVYHADPEFKFVDQDNFFDALNRKRIYLLVKYGTYLDIVQVLDLKKKSYTTKWKNQYELVDVHHLDDIFILNKYGGFIHANPESPIYFIFSQKGILYKNERAINRFYQELHKTSLSAAQPGYRIVYQYFSTHDTVYYQTKMEQFQKEIIEIFQQDPHEAFLTNFINNTKKDMIIEIGYVYHRFRNFPEERIQIYQKYANHPYVKLLKFVHDQFIQQRIFVDYHFLENLFHSPTDNQEFISLLVPAIAHRSELFGPVYELYLKSKNQTLVKQNYFPFKIFSSKLFILEHMFYRLLENE